MLNKTQKLLWHSAAMQIIISVVVPIYLIGD